MNYSFHLWRLTDELVVTISDRDGVTYVVMSRYCRSKSGLSKTFDSIIDAVMLSVAAAVMWRCYETADASQPVSQWMVCDFTQLVRAQRLAAYNTLHEWQLLASFYPAVCCLLRSTLPSLSSLFIFNQNYLSFFFHLHPVEVQLYLSPPASI